MVSQAIDSFIVLFIAFKIGAGWPLAQVVAIGLVNYTYKFIMAVLLTPVIYLAEHRIEKYVGFDVAQRMKKAAMGFEETPANVPAAG